MKTFKKIIFFLGLFLLAINIVGLFRTMRNPDIYTEENIIKNRKNDISIHYPEVKKLLVKKAGESNEAFAVRINKVVNDGFAHYWKDAGISKYHETVPAWENYLLFLVNDSYPVLYARPNESLPHQK